MKRFIPLYLAMTLTPMLASAQVIVNDSWADGGRNNGADAQDTDWWYSTSSSAIEVGPGFLGLVSGTSGRGIHGTFAAQSLSVGDTLTATFTFVTPATVGTSSTGFRAGFFDTTGKPGLAADISASSGTPNAIYNNLNGYMTDWDVNTGATADTAIRVRSNASSGQLMATTADYTSLGDSADAGYSFLASTSYVGVFSLTRTAGGLDLTSSLYQGATLLDTFMTTAVSPTATTFGMLAFHVGSNAFGSNGTVGAANNGIDFTNVKIEYIAAPVPEPSVLALSAAALGYLGFLRRRKMGSN